MVALWGVRGYCENALWGVRGYCEDGSILGREAVTMKTVAFWNVRRLL